MLLKETVQNVTKTYLQMPDCHTILILSHGNSIQVLHITVFMYKMKNKMKVNETGLQESHEEDRATRVNRWLYHVTGIHVSVWRLRMSGGPYHFSLESM